MFEVLRNHAVENVWCSPTQDNQIILSAERITKKGGDIVSTVVMTRRIALPEPKKYYHVFYIGQAHPAILGLLPLHPTWATQSWVKMTEAVNNLPLFVDVYADNGAKVPLNQVYYQYTNDRAFVFCIELKNSVDANFDQEQAYLRMYTNAYYDTIEADSLTMNTRTFSKLIYSTADILEVQGIETQWKALQGSVYSYVNGDLVDALNLITVKIGDYVDCIIDTSVKRVVDLKLTELKTFTSIRDQKQKYLLHYPETTTPDIDYVDDIDVYLYNKTGNRVIGRYVHRNQLTTLRMVTHRDYSLQVENIVNLSASIEERLANLGLDAGDLYVRLYIRNSGLFKKLPYENNRIFELYKLDNDSVVNALIGAESNVQQWRAMNLENSEFIKMLDIAYGQINIDLIEKAYGYNAISKILADSPIYRDDAIGAPEAFTLPVGLREGSTIYEYNAEGVMLGWSHHTTGSMHIAQNLDCAFVEGVVGIGTQSPPVVYGMDDLEVPSYGTYRVYMAYGADTVPTTPWRDITDSDYYEVVNGRLKWLTQDEDYIVMIRSDAGFLAYDLTLTPVAGTLYFPLSEVSGGLHREMPIPGADLDVWLNGKSLTRGLDFVLDFPNLYIFNKDYLVQPAGSTPQRLTIRFTGFAEPTADGFVSAELTDDFGFIEHGVLSNNNRYDIRDDRVMSIYVKGCLKKREDVIFSEEHQGVSISNALNGQPYQLKERVIPLRGLTQQEASELRQLSQGIDAVISDYMTVHLPQPERVAVSAIQQRHRLFSPFFSHLVNDLASGQFPREKIQKKLLDQDILDICKDYVHLLEHDPLNENLNLDYRFVLIHPHQLDTTVLLDVESYAFLKQVVRLYGKNLISLSGHLNINAIEE